MIIETVRVKHFRSVLDEELNCRDLTALVGANGSGKSSFLHGMELFYSPSPKCEKEDFYNGDTSSDMAVAITYGDLSQDAKDLFGAYVQADKLTVERVFSWNDSKVSSTYHGATLQCKEFQPVRAALQVRDRGRTAREAYEKLQSISQFDTLPPWSNLGAVENTLKKWEDANQDQCVRLRDDGQFFGFKEVARGYLGRFAKFLFIPAVRDASDDTAEGKGSVITELMDLVVRSVIAGREDLMALKEEAQEKYERIIDPSQLGELTTLQSNLNQTLKNFAPEAAIELKWSPIGEIEMPTPRAEVKLVESGYASTVSRTGHGLQRAFILTLLQHLAFASPPATPEGEESGTVPPGPTATQLPNLVLAIEEPELYQHPNRQRHMARVLHELASGMTPGVAEKTQVIYSTHSPLFVGIDRIEKIRLLRRVADSPGKPNVTRVVSTTLDNVARKLWEADGSPGTEYTGETLAPRLVAVMTPWMSEGFFSEVAVLVEGEDDRAAILGVAKSKGIDLESREICVIPCGGKTNIDKPAAIFLLLGIPCYLVWDGDKG
ncbi:MAG: ATP-dependent endonuclease, partial [Bacteroidota bacterium]